MNPRKCLLTQASQLPRLSSTPFFRPRPFQWPSLSPVRIGQQDVGTEQWEQPCTEVHTEQAGWRDEAPGHSSLWQQGGRYRLEKRR